MSSINEFLESDHVRCDGIFEQVQQCVERINWAGASRAMRAFETALEHHFVMEEQGLFPLFEQATGSNAGPTAVMRMEHKQLRQIVATAQAAIEQRDVDEFFSAAETLSIMMRQHNLKEEGILYPMADRVLAGRIDQVIQAMQARRDQAGSSASSTPVPHE